MLNPELLNSLILTPEAFLATAQKTDFGQRVMQRMAEPAIQRMLIEADFKRDTDWSALCNQVVGAEMPAVVMDCGDAEAKTALKTS